MVNHNFVSAPHPISVQYQIGGSNARVQHILRRFAGLWRYYVSPISIAYAGSCWKIHMSNKLDFEKGKRPRQFGKPSISRPFDSIFFGSKTTSTKMWLDRLISYGRRMKMVQDGSLAQKLWWRLVEVELPGDNAASEMKHPSSPDPAPRPG
jgi:hypothetical protein